MGGPSPAGPQADGGAAGSSSRPPPPLHAPLAQQVPKLTGRSQIIVRGTSAQTLQSVLPLVQLLGGRILRQLPHLNSAAVDMPNAMLLPLAASSLVARLTLDRILAGSMERT